MDGEGDVVQDGAAALGLKAQLVDGEDRAVGDRGLGGLRGGELAATIISASWREVVSAGTAVPTVVPRRMTVMSSATESTSPSLWEMKMTDRPSDFSSRRLWKRASTSCGTSTAVGSSRMRMRAPR